MKVKVKVPFICESGTYDKGQQIEVDEAFASSLVAGGLAEKVEATSKKVVKKNENK